MKRKWILIVIVVLLIVGGLLISSFLRQAQVARENLFQTAPIERGSLTALVGATGSVRANQTAMLAWQTTGRINSINAEVGDTVDAGYVLAELKQSSLPQNVIMAQADLVTASRSLEELRTSEVARAQAQLKLTQAEDVLDQAQKNRERKDYSRSSQATLDSARADYILAQNQVEKAEENYSGVADRGEDDPIRAAALSALSAARKARDRALANLNYLLGKPGDLEIAQADAELKVAQANLEDAQREWGRLKDGPDPEDIKAAEVRVAALEATLELVHLDAPFAGTITEVVSKVGDAVAPGTVSFRIDDLSRLVVDIEISEVDINRIQIGQPVQLSFDAIPGKQFSGKVSQVAQVGSLQQGIVNFMVSVDLQNANGAVLPGMTAAVNIVVSQLDDVLLVPNRAVRLRAGQRVVYILKNGIPTPINVTLGASSETTSELVKGDIQEGDQVLLNPPAEFEAGGGPFMR